MSAMKEMKICAGCAVRWPHEHRCHGGNCQCIECAAVAAQAELTTLRAELAQCRGELQQVCDDVLVALAGAGIATPEETYRDPQARAWIRHNIGLLKAERDTLKQSHAKLLEDYENANAEADTLKGEMERLREEVKALRSVEKASDRIQSAQTKLRQEIESELTSHRLLLDEMAGRTIQGKSLRDYLCEQFPATVGHVPLREYFEQQQAALTKYQQQCGEKV